MVDRSVSPYGLGMRSGVRSGSTNRPACRPPTGLSRVTAVTAVLANITVIASWGALDLPDAAERRTIHGARHVPGDRPAFIGERRLAGPRASRSSRTGSGPRSVRESARRP